MQNKPFAFRGGRGQRAQVVAGWAEAAVDDQHIRLFAAFAQNRHQRIEIVANGMRRVNGKP
jgi:hypothetical protein